MDTNMAMIAPEELIKTWMAFGGEALQQFMKPLTSDRTFGRKERMNDTIFALATAGRDVPLWRSFASRVPKVERGLSALGVRPTKRHVACLRALRDSTGALIDRAIVLRFAAPNTFTGEPMAELQVHSGEAVVDAVATELFRAGLRMAEPQRSRAGRSKTANSIGIRRKGSPISSMPRPPPKRGRRRNSSRAPWAIDTRDGGRRWSRRWRGWRPRLTSLTRICQQRSPNRRRPR